VRLIKGGRGNYDVRFGEHLIFSKKAVGRFPEDDEVLNPIAERLNASPPD